MAARILFSRCSLLCSASLLRTKEQSSRNASNPVIITTEQREARLAGRKEARIQASNQRTQSRFEHRQSRKALWRGTRNSCKSEEDLQDKPSAERLVTLVPGLFSIANRYNQTYMSVLTIIVEYYLSKSIKVKRFDTRKNCLLLARYQKVSAHSSTNKQAIAIQKQEWGSGGLVPPPLQVKNHRFLWKNIKNHHHPHVVVDCFFVYLLYILL